MGTVWLHDLPEWLAQDPKLRVRFYPGWELRSRSSGGFNAVRAIGLHHTASAKTGTTAGDTRYMWENAPTKPIGNIYLARDGEVVIGAAGAANTMGMGGPLATSKGMIPLNDGNRYMLAIEAANNGTGETWPDVQLEAYVRLVAVLVRNLGLDPMRDIYTHHGYCQPSCPGRKIDPAGPTPLYPDLGGTTGKATWPQESFRLLVVRQLAMPGEIEQPSTDYWPGTPLPSLADGASGDQARALIDVLKFWRWYPAEFAADTNDGKIGKRATAGIRAMQTALKVQTSGVYDTATASAYSTFLHGMASLACSMPPAPLALGMRNADVGALQTFLASRGWYRFTIDQSYGPRTQQGVQQLQRACRANDLDAGPINGLYGEQTRAAACALIARGG